MEINENPFLNNLGKYLPVDSALKFDQIYLNKQSWDTWHSSFLYYLIPKDILINGISKAFDF